MINDDDDDDEHVWQFRRVCVFETVLVESNIVSELYGTLNVGSVEIKF